jgi:hypothetical protein
VPPRDEFQEAGRRIDFPGQAQRLDADDQELRGGPHLVAVKDMPTNDAALRGRDARVKVCAIGA